MTRARAHAGHGHERLVVAGVALGSELRAQVVDATMKRAAFFGHLAFPGSRHLARERTEAVVQLAPQCRDLRFAPLELFQLQRECVLVAELPLSHG